MELLQLIESLTQPIAYSYPVASVEVRQTHISVVFLAGPFAYKVKKPVTPGFLDFSTIEKRLHFCQEEVRLNRRLAPDVYLGVVPVVRTPGGVRFEGEGEPIEWAVKMRRLPDDATLLERLQRGQLDGDRVGAVARRIAAFHQAAETNERIASFGGSKAVAKVILDVLDRARPRIEIIGNRGVFDRVRTLTVEALDRLRLLIDERAARGVTRDCHGDLHLDHIYDFPGKNAPSDLVIVDCIEFDERLRLIDPVSDMAFLAMDFAFHGRRDLAREFTDTYFDAAKDASGRALLPLYSAHRAAVRGMVDGLLACEAEVPEAERAAALARSRAHWLLALTELEPPERRPCLLLVAGLPGTGKSTVARALGEHAGFEVIRSDVVRKELAGLASQSTPASLRDSLYGSEWTDRTYDECRLRAERALAEGRRVLVDATFREDRHRRDFLDGAVRCGAPAAILHCEAEPETVRRRLETRRGDASDADWSIYLQLAGSWEEFSPEVVRVLHTVSTDGPAESMLERALDALRRWGLQNEGIAPAA